MSNSRPIEILLVEDNPGDIILTKKAFEKAKIANIIHIAKDGEVALKMLLQENQYANTPLPDLVFLDLNIPKKDGHEVLEVIKTNDTLKHIPVIILSSSNAESDINATYNHHANCYVTKPLDINQFQEFVQSIDHFWFNIVSLPNVDNAKAS